MINPRVMKLTEYNESLLVNLEDVTNMKAGHIGMDCKGTSGL